MACASWHLPLHEWGVTYQFFSICIRWRVKLEDRGCQIFLVSFFIYVTFTEIRIGGSFRGFWCAVSWLVRGRNHVTSKKSEGNLATLQHPLSLNTPEFYSDLQMTLNPTLRLFLKWTYISKVSCNTATINKDATNVIWLLWAIRSVKARDTRCHG